MANDFDDVNAMLNMAGAASTVMAGDYDVNGIVNIASAASAVADSKFGHDKEPKKEIQIEPIETTKELAVGKDTNAVIENDNKIEKYLPGEVNITTKYNADKASMRADELRVNPIEGKFNADHLKRINQYILQDSPDLKGGEYRPDDGNQLRDRKVYGQEATYLHQFKQGKINDNTLNGYMKEFGSIDDFKQLDNRSAVDKLSKLYADIDDAGAFNKGNNKTARVFIEQIASEAGYNVDWSKINEHSKKLAADKKVSKVATIEPVEVKKTNERIETGDTASIDKEKTKEHDVVAAKKTDSQKHIDRVNSFYNERLDQIKEFYGRQSEAVKSFSMGDVKAKLVNDNQLSQLKQLEIERAKALDSYSKTTVDNPYKTGKEQASAKAKITEKSMDQSKSSQLKSQAQQAQKIQQANQVRQAQKTNIESTAKAEKSAGRAR